MAQTCSLITFARHVKELSAELFTYSVDNFASLPRLIGMPVQIFRLGCDACEPRFTSWRTSSKKPFGDPYRKLPARVAEGLKTAAGVDQATACSLTGSSSLTELRIR